MSIDLTLGELVSNQFGIDAPQKSDQEVLALLADRISELLAGDLENFMSMMYRLDVSESKIQAALSPDNPEAPNWSLAKLIIERQLQRLKTKETYRQEPLDDWIDF